MGIIKRLCFSLTKLSVLQFVNFFFVVIRIFKKIKWFLFNLFKRDHKKVHKYTPKKVDIEFEMVNWGRVDRWSCNHLAGYWKNKSICFKKFYIFKNSRYVIWAIAITPTVNITSVLRASNAITHRILYTWILDIVSYKEKDCPNSWFLYIYFSNLWAE